MLGWCKNTGIHHEVIATLLCVFVHTRVSNTIITEVNINTDKYRSQSAIDGGASVGGAGQWVTNTTQTLNILVKCPPFASLAIDYRGNGNQRGNRDSQS